MGGKKIKRVLKYGGVLVLLLVLLPSLLNNLNVDQPLSTPGNNPGEALGEQADQSSEDHQGQDITTSTSQKGEYVKVTRVIDGDTFEIETGKTVRMIGIDTPETVHPTKPVECFGKEASIKTKELISGQTVRLEKDVSETDKYNRLLRYVFIDNTFINEVLVRDGYAHASSYPPDVKYQEKFTQAQRLARNERKGLWGDMCANYTETTQQTTSSTNTIPNNSSGYSCSGVDYDCSDFATQKQAQAFFDGCGFSATNDPMKLDSVGIGDGVACETLP